jgi:DNA repair exonuclease SbcCD ATPase subunit
MQILKLSIQGFKSFTKEQVLDFTKFDNGLIFVSGKNKVEPSLGGNGTGKSSLFEALTFALYGKTSTNDKAGNLKNWQTKEKCKVSVDFIHHDTMYTLDRTWNPNTLKLNDETVTQETIDTLLGINFSAFIYSIFISQQADKFIDLAPVEKMDIFTTILDLDKWNTFSDKAKELKTVLEKGSLANEKLRLSLEGEVAGINLEELSKLSQEYERTRKTKIKELKTNKAAFTTKYVKVLDTIGVTQKTLEELKATQTTLSQSVLVINQEIDTYNQMISSEGKTLYRYETRLDYEEDEYEKLVKTENSPICGTCFQPINSALLRQNIKTIEDKIAEIKLQIDNTKGVHSGLKEELFKLQDEQSIEVTTLNEIRKQIDILNMEIAALERDAHALLFQQEALDKDLQQLQDGTNPYSDMKQKRQARLEELTTQIQELINEETLIQKQYTIYDYWIKGFKDTKLMLLSEALQEFEIETNNKLQELGMLDWSITTEVDTETKSGTIKRGFTILVKSPINETLVPFTCWSGGEGQRLRLAVTLGLIDFIKNKRGVSWDILIFDEGTQFLSEEGISDLITTLKDKAINDNLKILLIDHRNLNSYGDFIKEITVTKTEQGSQIWNT